MTSPQDSVDRATLGDSERCANCGAATPGAHCSECGQRRAQRITFKRVLSEALEHVGSLDSALLRTVIGLTRAPGQVCRAYIQGQRKSFVNPLKYTFLMATVFALVINVFDILPANIPADNESAIKTYKFVVGGLGYLAFLYMLPVAAAQAALFRRAYGVAECYVSLVYFYGHFLLCGTLLAAVGLYSTPYGIVTMRALGLVYMLWLLAGLYESTKAGTFLKGFLHYLVFTIANMGTGMIVAVMMGVGR